MKAWSASSGGGSGPDEYEFDLQDVTALPDGRIAAHCRERARGKASGALVEAHLTGYWTIANGKATHYRGEIERRSLR